MRIKRLLRCNMTVLTNSRMNRKSSYRLYLSRENCNKILVLICCQIYRYYPKKRAKKGEIDKATGQKHQQSLIEVYFRNQKQRNNLNNYNNGLYSYSNKLNGFIYITSQLEMFPSLFCHRY